MAKSKPVARAARRSTAKVPVSFVARKPISRKAAELPSGPFVRKVHAPTNWAPGRGYLGPVSQAAK